jgi:hypothetical protein
MQEALMGKLPKFALVVLAIAIAAPGYAAERVPSKRLNLTPGAPNFVLRAARTLTVDKDATISGGAVVARRAVVSGGKVESLYAPSVRLESAAVRGGLFTDKLDARASEYKRQAPFDPNAFGALNRRPIVAPGDNELVVPAGREIVLKGSMGPVHIKKGGTLVIPGGFYELASLTLDAGASVVAREPTRLAIKDRLVMGPAAYIGPPRNSNVKLNLQLLIAGRDGDDLAAVEIGVGATIAADLLAPAGSVQMRRQVKAYGRYEAQDIAVAAGVSVAGMGLGPFQPCGQFMCWGEAVAGGTIDIQCGWVSLAPDIDNWINSHSKIRDAIQWQFQTSGSPYDPQPQDFVSYVNWTSAEKAALKQSFDTYWQAYCNNTPLQGDIGLQDPLVNVAENVNSDINAAQTKIAEQDMKALLLADIGHALVLEIGDYVPWSILTDDTQSLEIFFSSLGHGRRMSLNSDFTVAASGPITNIHNWRVSYGWVTPSPPAGTFNFLKSNSLIGNTRHQTIVNLLNWSRNNMIHFFGAYNFTRTEEIWQYRGHPPVSRVVSGTTDPQYGFEHWTAGCHGTAGWYRAVLRTANIPVQVPIACQHAQIYFRSEGLYLDHGDNPYTGYTNALWPPEEALIDEATYVDWFGANLDNQTTGCDNVGRRPQELNDQYSP